MLSFAFCHSSVPSRALFKGVKRLSKVRRSVATSLFKVAIMLFKRPWALAASSLSEHSLYIPTAKAVAAVAAIIQGLAAIIPFKILAPVAVELTEVSKVFKPFLINIIPDAFSDKRAKLAPIPPARPSHFVLRSSTGDCTALICRDTSVAIS